MTSSDCNYRDNYVITSINIFHLQLVTGASATASVNDMPVKILSYPGWKLRLVLTKFNFSRVQIIIDPDDHLNWSSSHYLPLNDAFN